MVFKDAQSLKSPSLIVETDLTSRDSIFLQPWNAYLPISGILLTSGDSSALQPWNA